MHQNWPLGVDSGGVKVNANLPWNLVKGNSWETKTLLSTAYDSWHSASCSWNTQELLHLFNTQQWPDWITSLHSMKHIVYMKAIALFAIVGSYCFVFFFWRNTRKSSVQWEQELKKNKMIRQNTKWNRRLWKQRLNGQLNSWKTTKALGQDGIPI